MPSYTRLTLAEREEISRALAAGSRLRTIARQLGRAPRTIGRQLPRPEPPPRRARGDQPRAGGREPPANDCPAARTRPQHDRTGIAPRGAHPEHLPGHARPARRETRGPAAAEAPDAPVPPGLRAGRLGAALVAGADCHAAADGVS